MGVLVGKLEGSIDGTLLGSILGIIVGIELGIILGIIEGRKVGELVGNMLGSLLGLVVGLSVGVFDGIFVGRDVGISENPNELQSKYSHCVFNVVPHVRKHQFVFKGSKFDKSNIVLPMVAFISKLVLTWNVTRDATITFENKRQK